MSFRSGCVTYSTECDFISAVRKFFRTFKLYTLIYIGSQCKPKQTRHLSGSWGNIRRNVFLLHQVFPGTVFIKTSCRIMPIHLAPGRSRLPVYARVSIKLSKETFDAYSVDR